jgi:tRNA1(Val) A37 N6-methylase TrmN6
MDEHTEDTLLSGKVRLRQPAEGYRAAIDPVLLAAAVPAAEGSLVLDVGVGAGAAALCLAARVPGCRIVGLEVQPEMAQLARENVQANGFAGRVEVLTGNVAAPPPRLAPGSFHHVMSNPPYLSPERANASGTAAKTRANVEGEADLASWLRLCVNMLRPKGTLSLIHRADRLDEILALLRGRVGELVVIPLWPKAGRPAKRVIIRGRKGLATPLELAPGLVLHEADGRYTPQAEALLRGAVSLD